MALYILAKLAEVFDHEIAAALGVVTGHTLKHLIATGEGDGRGGLGIEPAIS